MLIAECDLRLASVYGRIVAGMPRLEIAGVVTNGDQVLRLVERSPVDLIILDLQLSGMGGVTLLRRLRAGGIAVDVIAVTARCESTVVRSVVQHGAIDYIVKPFEPERLRRAIGLFLNRTASLGAERLDQEEIDRVTGAFRPPTRWLPRGLTESILRTVRDQLESVTTPASSADMSQLTGLARITVRRYLEYLVTTERGTVHAEPNGAGRPRKLYMLTRNWDY
ncbi:MAG: response regulator [Solirubrobacteraceae bacterium]